MEKKSETKTHQLAFLSPLLIREKNSSSSPDVIIFKILKNLSRIECSLHVLHFAMRIELWWRLWRVNKKRSENIFGILATTFKRGERGLLFTSLEATEKGEKDFFSLQKRGKGIGKLEKGSFEARFFLWLRGRKKQSNKHGTEQILLIKTLGVVGRLVVHSVVHFWHLPKSCQSQVRRKKFFSTPISRFVDLRIWGEKEKAKCQHFFSPSYDVIGTRNTDEGIMAKVLFVRKKAFMSHECWLERLFASSFAVRRGKKRKPLPSFFEEALSNFLSCS